MCGDRHRKVQLGCRPVQKEQASPAAVHILGPDVAKQAQLLLPQELGPACRIRSGRCRLSGPGSMLLPVHRCITKHCFQGRPRPSRQSRCGLVQLPACQSRTTAGGSSVLILDTGRMSGAIMLYIAKGDYLRNLPTLYPKHESNSLPEGESAAAGNRSWAPRTPYSSSFSLKAQYDCSLPPVRRMLDRRSAAG